MSQNDFVIDNGTGLAVRQDIESAFQALAGNNSGNSTPTTTYHYQWWADTSANVMKITQIHLVQQQLTHINGGQILRLVF